MGFITDILSDENITAYGKLVYFALSKYIGRNGTCWPSIKTISENTGISSTTVKRVIVERTSSRWVVKQNRKTDFGDRDANLYFLPFLGVGSDRTNVGSIGTKGLGLTDL